MVLRRAEAQDATRADRLADACGLSLDSARELVLEHSQLWLAEEQGQLCGLALGWLVADELEVVDVAVDAAWRRRGLGGALLDKLLVSAQQLGARWAFLEVRAGNVGARALYESKNFERVGERLGYYADGEDAWLFRCCLGAAGQTD